MQHDLEPGRNVRFLQAAAVIAAIAFGALLLWQTRSVKPTPPVSPRAIKRLKHGADGEGISGFDDCVAKVAFNAVHAFLRRRYPERTRLRNRLWYLFSHDRRFAVWEAGGETVCGIAAWRGRAAKSVTIPAGRATNAMLDRKSPAAALHAIFAHVNEPLRFDDLVRLAAELWHVVDVPRAEIRGDERAHGPGPAVELETRQYAEALWDKVRQLPDNQRTALLLNLRDVGSTNGMSLLLLSGIATIDQLATALGMTEERLAQIWNDLPYDDLTIGGMLGLTRQQVINLRKSARERLARRMTARNRWK